MKFLWVKAAVAWIQKAVAHKGSARGKAPRKKPAASERSLQDEVENRRLEKVWKRLEREDAFRRKTQQVLQLPEKSKLWLTSSTWGGRIFAAFLLGGVFGWIPFYLYLTPTDAAPLMSDATPLMYVQLYVVIVIGIGSLYIAGTNFWAKQGSAFFVEYQIATDINTAEFIRSNSMSEEIIGNPANSTMPYVKKITIRNEKNKHEAIKRILLQLSNKHTLILKEYEKAGALLIKPYEGKELELNSVTGYFKKCNLSQSRGRIDYIGKEVMLIESEETLNKGEIIIETVRGQSYIKSNKKSILFYEKEKVLIPIKSTFRENGLTHELIFGIDVFSVNEIKMKEDFVNNDIFYSELIEEFNNQGISLSKFGARESSFKIQITLDANREALLCYSFQANKKNYAFPVQNKMQDEFAKKFNKNKSDYNHLNNDDFVKQFVFFFRDWANNKWSKDKDDIIHAFRSVNNPFAVANMDVKTIEDEMRSDALISFLRL